MAKKMRHETVAAEALYELDEQLYSFQVDPSVILERLAVAFRRRAGGPNDEIEVVRLDRQTAAGLSKLAKEWRK